MLMEKPTPPHDDRQQILTADERQALLDRFMGRDVTGDTTPGSTSGNILNDAIGIATEAETPEHDMRYTAYRSLDYARRLGNVYNVSYTIPYDDYRASPKPHTIQQFSLSTTQESSVNPKLRITIETNSHLPAFLARVVTKRYMLESEQPQGELLPNEFVVKFPKHDQIDGEPLWKCSLIDGQLEVRDMKGKLITNKRRLKDFFLALGSMQRLIQEGQHLRVNLPDNTDRATQMQEVVANIFQNAEASSPNMSKDKVWQLAERYMAPLPGKKNILLIGTRDRYFLVFRTVDEKVLFVQGGTNENNRLSIQVAEFDKQTRHTGFNYSTTSGFLVGPRVSSPHEVRQLIASPVKSAIIASILGEQDFEKRAKIVVDTYFAYFVTSPTPDLPETKQAVKEDYDALKKLLDSAISQLIFP